MGEEFRKGYNNPLEAESQAARMGARQRQWDEERAARHAAPPPPIPDYAGSQGGAGGGSGGGSSGGAGGWGRAGWFAGNAGNASAGAQWHRQGRRAAPAGIGDSARTGAILGAIGALLYLYFNHRWSIPLAVVWAVAGLVGGFVAGAALHLAFIVLRVALVMAMWLLIGYVVLYMLGVLPQREHRPSARERAAVKVAAPQLPVTRALQLPR